MEKQTLRNISEGSCAKGPAIKIDTISLIVLEAQKTQQRFCRISHKVTYDVSGVILSNSERKENKSAHSGLGPPINQENAQSTHPPTHAYPLVNVMEPTPQLRILFLWVHQIDN